MAALGKEVEHDVIGRAQARRVKYRNLTVDGAAALLKQ